MSESTESKPEIVPAILPDVKMDEYFSTVFSMTGVASIISVKITAYEPNKEVLIEGPKLHGKYYDPFPIDSDGIKYRIDNNFVESNDWDNVPDGKTIDVYLWKAPSPLIKMYKYLVEIEYMTISDSSEGGSGVSVKAFASKVYSHNVYGTWDKWQRILRGKIDERQPIWPV